MELHSIWGDTLEVGHIIDYPPREFSRDVLEEIARYGARFAFSTTVDYQGHSRQVLRDSGFVQVAHKVNPNSGASLQLWWREDPTAVLTRPRLARGFSLNNFHYCCGGRWASGPLARPTNFLVLRRVRRPLAPTRSLLRHLGYTQFAESDGETFWTNGELYADFRRRASIPDSASSD